MSAKPKTPTSKELTAAVSLLRAELQTAYDRLQAAHESEARFRAAVTRATEEVRLLFSQYSQAEIEKAVSNSSLGRYRNALHLLTTALVEEKEK